MSSQQPNNQNQSMASHGRGGAGNMAESTKSPRLQASDLETPVLKNSVVTTGRGGSGNMAKNKDPAETRLMQDIGAVPRGSRPAIQHSGRGGAGNVFKDVEADNEKGEGAKNLTAEQNIDEGANKPRSWIFGKSKELK